MTGIDPSNYDFIVDIGSGKFTEAVILEDQGNILVEVNNMWQPESEVHTMLFQLSKAATGVTL